MTPDASSGQVGAEPEGEPVDDAGNGDVPVRHPGIKRRKKLAGLLDEDPVTTGNIELMLGGAAEFGHRIVLRGKRLTSNGGPADVVLELVQGLTKTIRGVMPSADPYLRSVAAGNSIEVNFYTPPVEIEEAKDRLRGMVEEPGTAPADEAALTEDQAGADATVLPDTTLAVLMLSSVLNIEDPAAAALGARQISKAAADEVRQLAMRLFEADITLDVGSVRPGVMATPEWCLSVVEHLDAEAEMPPRTVTVYGLLQGANSGGEGAFELVTEAARPLPPELGNYRAAGERIRGTLTPRARKQIREGNLWDAQVKTRVQVIRTEHRGRTKVEGFRLMSLEPLE